MLSMGRNPGEYLMIGDEIVVKVISVDGQLRLAIDAPKDMAILRGEVYEQNHMPPRCIQEKRVTVRKEKRRGHDGPNPV